MKKIVILFIFIPFLGISQSFKVGLNVANMTLGNSAYESSSSLKRLEFGFVTNRMKINNNLNLHFESLISWRGMNYSFDKQIKNYYNALNYKINTNYKVKLTYWEIPIILDANVGPVVVEFGPSLSFRVSGKRVGNTTITKDYTIAVDEVTKISEDGRYGNNQFFPKGIDASSPLSFIDVGMNLGVQYALSDDLYINARYYYGLTDVFRKNYPVQNSSTTSQLNLLFKLSLGIKID